MAVYDIWKVVRDARVALDRNNMSKPLVEAGDIETLTLDEIIASKVVDAVGRIHRAAPATMLDTGCQLDGGVYWEDGHRGRVDLPDDFMRLLVFQMSDWERAVYDPITPDSAEYALQRSRYRGLGGTPQRPVVAIATRPTGWVLEFYSCKSQEAEVERGVYVPWPRVDELGGVEIASKCYRAAVLMTAALTAAEIGETELAAALEAQAGAQISG